MHDLLEQQNPTYVRRRCFGHLPWRVCDAGLDELDVSGEDLYTKSKAIMTYLHDGVTWMRLKAFAVRPPAEGGLGMMVEHSTAYVDFFGSAPPTVMDERPETSLGRWSGWYRGSTSCVGW